MVLRPTYADENHGGQGKWKCPGYWDQNLRSAVIGARSTIRTRRRTGRRRFVCRGARRGDEMSDEDEDVNAGMEKPVVFPEDMVSLSQMEMAKKMTEIVGTG